MPNIEIKARCPDLDQARETARRLGAKHLGLDRQIDTYFFTKVGRLKLRESSLSGAWLIPYLRNDDAGPKKSDYALIELKDAPTTKRLLSETLGVETVVKKHRDIYLAGNVRIHLDQVDGLGTFFEFEAVYQDESVEAEKREHAKVRGLMTSFSIGENDLIRGSYREKSALPDPTS